MVQDAHRSPDETTILGSERRWGFGRPRAGGGGLTVPAAAEPEGLEILVDERLELLAGYKVVLVEQHLGGLSGQVPSGNRVMYGEDAKPT